MKRKKVFIDGSEGTTGLRIMQRLGLRKDIELLALERTDRKRLVARLSAVKEADVSILCLPDAAASELLQSINFDTRLIDTSSFHRTDPDWIYGFPELSGLRPRIQGAKRVANPGCYATGFIALIRPLIEGGYLLAERQFYCHALSGYSGGGKALIQTYEDSPQKGAFSYNLTLDHKHLPEMTQVSGLTQVPIFSPSVINSYSGMIVSIPLPKAALLRGRDQVDTLEQLIRYYQAYYQGEPLVHIQRCPQQKQLALADYADRDDLLITVSGNDEQILLSAQLDNLGKGASGAAIQSLNLMLGVNEWTGLIYQDSDKEEVL